MRSYLDIDPVTDADAHMCRLEQLHDPAGRRCFECNWCLVPHPQTELPDYMIDCIATSGKQKAQIASMLVAFMDQVAIDCSWCLALKEFIDCTESAVGCDCFRLDETAVGV